MTKTSLIAGAIFVLGFSAPLSAAETLPWDTVAVSFKEPVGDRFVSVLHLVMGTETIQKQSPTRYRFRIGDRGNQNDYAVFFAHLPYVKAVEPLPKLSAAERELPDVVVAVDPATRGLPRGYVPGQLLVKPKAGASAQAIAQLHQSLGASPKERIEGIDVFLMTLPSGLSVEEARKRYMASGLVEYAEPNRVMSLPPQPGGDPIQPDNGGPGIYLSPKQLLGTHLLVRYRSGGPTPALIDQVYGTRPLERTDADQVRLSLPPSMNPLVAARIFRLCPWVSQAEPAYGR